MGSPCCTRCQELTGSPGVARMTITATTRHLACPVTARPAAARRRAASGGNHERHTTALRPADRHGPPLPPAVAAVRPVRDLPGAPAATGTDVWPDVLAS